MTPAQQRYYERNRDKVIAKARECNARDPEARRAYMADNYEKNKTARKARQAAWRRGNPHAVRSQIATRRARKKNLAVELTNEQRADVIALYAKARALSELTGEPYHVDHIKPLSKGGLHHPDNLQVLRGVDNLRKGVRDWQELAREVESLRGGA